MDKNLKIVLIGARMGSRTFFGANKALPVLTHALFRDGFTNVIQMDMDNPGYDTQDILTESSDADLIGISGLSTQLNYIDYISTQIYNHLQQKGRQNIPIIIGGYAAKGAKEVILNSPHITAFFNGEGEEGIVTIAAKIANRTFRESMREIKGLCYIDAEGGYHESVADRVKKLDYNQNFLFNHIPEVHNMDIFKGRDGRILKTAQMFTQRGCVYNCAYCNKSMEEKKVVYVSFEDFESQIKELKEYGYEAIYLDDDTATINKSRFREYMKIIARYGLKIGFNTRIDIEARRIRENDSDIKFAKKCGAVYEFFGVEHTDHGVLMAIDKFNGNQTQKLARKYIDDVKLVFSEMEKEQLPSSYFFMLGLPKFTDGEYRPTTITEDKKAIEFALEECHPDYLNFNILRFMPGTKASDLNGRNNPFYCVRPTGEDPISGAHFLDRLHKDRQDYHMIFKCFESIGEELPRSTSITPERAYETIQFTLDLINNKVQTGQKATKLFIDEEILKKELIRIDKNGRYHLKEFKNFN